MSQRTNCTLLSLGLMLVGLPRSASCQNPPPPAKKPLVGPPSPQSTHYPILLLAFGNDPNWSLRIGLKGPERLDRAGYPPIPLEPAEVTHEIAVDSWTYHAKDSATGATVAVHLSREACTDALNDTLTAKPPPGGKFTFSASVEHAQIGTLKGCARVATELFPKINNRPDEDEDDTDKDKPPAPTVTSFKLPVDIAYISASKNVVFKRGNITRVVAPLGLQPTLSHDGKRLLYSREEGPLNRAIVLYDWSSGKSVDLIHGVDQQVAWSPDDSRIAFRKWANESWQLWVAPVTAPENATLVYPAAIVSIGGWVGDHIILVSDFQQLSWVREDGTVEQTLPTMDLYGDAFRVTGDNTVRTHPKNPDLLLVAAERLKPLAGASADQHMGNGFGAFLYEIRSKRRVLVSPADMFSQNAEWSRDGLQIFFTGAEASRRYSTYRMFWDGTGLQKYSLGTHLVIGQ